MPTGRSTPIAGSPFDAGGAGTGAPFGSAGGLQETSDGRYLLATDPGQRTRSPSSGSSRTAGCSWSTSRTPTARAADQHRRPRRPRLRRERRRRRQQLHRLPAQCRRPPPPDRGLDLRPAGRRAARPRPDQPGRPPARRHAGRPERRSVLPRRLPDRRRRTPDARSRLALRGPADRPVRQRVLADARRPAVRLERPRRRGRRLASRSTTSRRTESLSAIAGSPVRRQPDRAVLGRDQPRRTRALRGEHGGPARSRATRSPRTAR